jgi:hypothetical protein
MLTTKFRWITLLLCFAFGIFLKIYDDIIDNKLNINIDYIEYLKYFVITLFSLVFYNDVVFSIIYFFMTVASFLMDKYYTKHLETSKDTVLQKDFTAMNDNIWIYSSILSGVSILYHFFLNFQKLSSVFIVDYKNITFLVSLVINLIIIVTDIYFTPEHASNKKLFARICVLIILCLFVYYMTPFSEYIYEGNYGIMLMHLGFLTSSICFLTLDKFHSFEKYKVVTLESTK